MLEPQSRTLLLDSLAAPPEHQLDWAVGTTYSLDLIALLAAPVAFAFSNCHDRVGKPIAEPLALLKATRQYADRILLFCQAGRIRVPRAYQPLLLHLEGSIAEALAPRGGAFHPKVWFLRYLGPDQSVTYRLLCLSRNMTFDRSWDTVLVLDGALKSRTNAFARNHPLGEFVEGLPRMLRRPLHSRWRQRLKQLAHELRRVDFELPEPFEDVAYWPIGLESAAWPFPNRMDRMLVVSPFVDDGFIDQLAAKDRGPMELVSRAESLDRLPQEKLRSFERLWVLDDVAHPEDATAETVTDREAETRSPDSPRPEETEAAPLNGLHAKCYIADVGWKSSVWTGSANATSAAFSKNVEFLVELRGKKSRCGTAAMLGQADAEGIPHVACLRDLLRPFVPRGAGEPNEPPEQELFERQADALARQVAARAGIASCEKNDADDFTLVLRATKPRPISIPAGASLRVWPISMRPDRATAAALDSDAWCRFERVSLLGLTSFFAWELVSADDRFAHQFVLCHPLENAPADRSECVLRNLLTDQNRVLRFLMLLLSDADADDFSDLIVPVGGADGDGLCGGAVESTLFESLLRALDRQPDQIDEVERVILDLANSPEGKKLLPSELDAIWEPIIQVRRRQRQGTTKK